MTVIEGCMEDAYPFREAAENSAQGERSGQAPGRCM